MNLRNRKLESPHFRVELANSRRGPNLEFQNMDIRERSPERRLPSRMGTNSPATCISSENAASESRNDSNDVNFVSVDFDMQESHQQRQNVEDTTRGPRGTSSSHGLGSLCPDGNNYPVTEHTQNGSVGNNYPQETSFENRNGYSETSNRDHAFSMKNRNGFEGRNYSQARSTENRNGLVQNRCSAAIQNGYGSHRYNPVMQSENRNGSYVGNGHITRHIHMDMDNSSYFGQNQHVNNAFECNFDGNNYPLQTHQGMLDGYNNPMQMRRTDRHYGIQNCNSSMQNFGVQNEQMNTNAAIIGNVNQNGTHGTIKSRNDLMEINSTHLYGRSDAQMSSSGESRDDYNQMITRNNMMTVPSSMYRNRPYRPQYDQPRPVLPVFNGQGKWESFIIPFKIMADRFDWGRRRQAEEIILCLRDEAQSFAAQLPGTIREDIDSLCSEMDKRFGDHTLPETHRRNLQKIKKQHSETYQKFSARVAENVRKAYPGINEQLFNSLCVEHMLSGISDQNVAYDVLTKRPQSLDEAINLLTWHQSCKSGLRNQTVSKRDFGYEDDFTEEEEEGSGISEVRRVNHKRYVTEERLQQFGRELKDSITDQVTKAVTENIKTTVVQSCRQAVKEEMKYCKRDIEYSKKEKPKIKCFACEEEGHIARNCPLRRQDNREDGRRDRGPNMVAKGSQERQLPREEKPKTKPKEQENL